MIGTRTQVINYLMNYKLEDKFEIKEYKEKRSLNANRIYVGCRR